MPLWNPNDSLSKNTYMLMKNNMEWFGISSGITRIVSSCEYLLWILIKFMAPTYWIAFPKCGSYQMLQTYDQGNNSIFLVFGTRKERVLG